MSGFTVTADLRSDSAHSRLCSTIRALGDPKCVTTIVTRRSCENDALEWHLMWPLPLRDVQLAAARFFIALKYVQALRCVAVLRTRRPRKYEL
eukprot:COSAG01_NODE_81_length_27820_cov_22.659753_26_plen_93_part_00